MQSGLLWPCCLHSHHSLVLFYSSGLIWFSVGQKENHIVMTCVDFKRFKYITVGQKLKRFHHLSKWQLYIAKKATDILLSSLDCKYKCKSTTYLKNRFHFIHCLFFNTEIPEMFWSALLKKKRAGYQIKLWSELAPSTILTLQHISTALPPVCTPSSSANILCDFQCLDQNLIFICGGTIPLRKWCPPHIQEHL